MASVNKIVKGLTLPCAVTSITAKNVMKLNIARGIAPQFTKQRRVLNVTLSISIGGKCLFNNMRPYVKIISHNPMHTI